MGWSEQYWEDVKAELEQMAAEAPLPGEAEDVRQASVGQPENEPEEQ